MNYYFSSGTRRFGWIPLIANPDLGPTPEEFAAAIDLGSPDLDSWPDAFIYHAADLDATETRRD